MAAVNTVVTAVDNAAEAVVAAGIEDVVVAGTTAADPNLGCYAELEERHLVLEGYSG